MSAAGTSAPAALVTYGMRRLFLLVAIGAIAVGGAGWVRWRWSRERPVTRHLRAAARLSAAGHLKEAGREWQIAAVLDPRAVEAREALGKLYLADGGTALAIREFRTVTELQPRRPHAYCQLAGALHEGGLNDLALEAARYAVRTEANCARAHRALGLLLGERQEFRAGAAELERAAALAPRDEEQQLTLARMYLGLAQLPQAEAAARSAYQLAPQDSEAASLLGHVLVQKGDRAGFEEAQQLLRAAVTANPADATAHVDLAKIFRRQLRPLAARWDLEQAVQANPRDREATQALAEVCADLGDAPRSAALRERVRSLAADDLSRKELERHLAQQPLDGKALYRLGDLYARDGQYSRAMDYLERAGELLDDPAVGRRLREVRAAAVRQSAPAGAGGA